MSSALPQSFFGFDTGIGGVLTMLKFLEMNLVPEAHVFIDPEFAPYGKQDDDIIKSRMISIVHHAWSVLPGPSFGVIACNTASMFLNDVQNEGFFDQPCGHGVIGVINPILNEIISLCSHQADAAPYSAKQEPLKSGFNIVVLATEKTIGKGFYQNHLQAALPNAHITAVACSDLATQIDEGQSLAIIANSLDRLIESCIPNAKDTEILVLACTHFQKVRPAIEAIFRRHGAEQLMLVVDQHKLTAGYAARCLPHLHPYASDTPRRMVIHATGDRTKTEAIVREVFNQNTRRTFPIEVELKRMHIPFVPMKDLRWRLQAAREQACQQPANNFSDVVFAV